MNLRTLASRLARIEGQRNNQRYQAAWDEFCDRAGWPRSSVGDATCIEDVLLGIEEGDQPSFLTTAQSGR